ncbi:DNA cytosine methyltransferase [Rhizobium leguminosarum]|uniref:DNA cytosine methyltransferase n=1 Tax=Rhizobium leguminosarum TaxID=384 RepID=UPI003F9E5ABB
MNPNSPIRSSASRPIPFSRKSLSRRVRSARLQGFPDDFRFHPTTWHSFRMIGNSVSPIIAKAVLEKVYERLDIDGKRQVAAE